jgi:hypothetical protein
VKLIDWKRFSIFKCIFAPAGLGRQLKVYPLFPWVAWICYLEGRVYAGVFVNAYLTAWISFSRPVFFCRYCNLLDLGQTSSWEWFLESTQMLYRAFKLSSKHNNAYSEENGSRA